MILTNERKIMISEMIKKFLIRVVIGFIICFIVGLLTLKSLFFKAQVVGNSMEPNLINNENLLIYKDISKIKRGDIVVASSPTEPNKEIIKRVIGIGGDTIKIENHKVYLNAKLLDEPYIKEKMNFPTADNKYVNAYTIPKDSYFLMGDNRNISNDSRIIGAILKNNIIGIAEFKIVGNKYIKLK